MKTVIFLFVSSVCAYSLQAQQYLEDGNSIISKSIINGAFAGTNYSCFTAGAQTKFFGIEQSPKLSYVSLDKRLVKIDMNNRARLSSHGFSVNFFNYSYSKLYNEAYLDISYAYHVETGNYTNLVFSVSTNFLSSQVKFSNFVGIDKLKIDPVLLNRAGDAFSISPATNIGTLFYIHGNRRKVHPTKVNELVQFFIGCSATRIFQFEIENQIYPSFYLQPKVHLHSGTRLSISPTIYFVPELYTSYRLKGSRNGRYQIASSICFEYRPEFKKYFSIGGRYASRNFISIYTAFSVWRSLAIAYYFNMTQKEIGAHAKGGQGIQISYNW
jgi:type IX secretion system PorP/SprF family membrane protein